MTRYREKIAIGTVIALLLLSGCSSPLSGEQPGGIESTTTEYENHDETAVATTTTATVENIALPAGANEQRIENASALYEVHLSALDGTDYAIKSLDSRIVNGTRTVVRREVSRSSLETNEQYRYTNSTDERGSDITATYVNGTNYYRKDADESVDYRASDLPPNSVRDSHLEKAMRSLVRSRLEAGEYENPELVRRNGQRFIRYNLTGLNDDVKFVLTDSVSDVMGSLLIDQNGLVHRLSMTIVKESRGREIRMQEEFRLSDVGNVTVQKPSWVSKARAEQHQPTTEESGIASRIRVLRTTGNVSDDTEVTDINMRVMRGSGSDEIDLSKATVEWVGPETIERLRYSPNTSASRFQIVGAGGSTGVEPVLDSQEDRFTLRINVTAVTRPLEASEEVKIKITTAQGETTYLALTVPESVAEKSSVELE